MCSVSFCVQARKSVSSFWHALDKRLLKKPVKGYFYPSNQTTILRNTYEEDPCFKKVLSYKTINNLELLFLDGTAVLFLAITRK